MRLSWCSTGNRPAGYRHAPKRNSGGLFAPYWVGCPISSHHTLLLLLWPGAARGLLPLARGIRPRFVAPPLPVLFGRDPRPDPRGQPHLPLVAGAPPSVPVDIDAVAPSVAESVVGCVRGTPERPSDVTSLPPAMWRFSVCSVSSISSLHLTLTLGSLSDAELLLPVAPPLLPETEAARYLYATGLGPRGPSSSGVPAAQNRGLPGTPGRAVQCRFCG